MLTILLSSIIFSGCAYNNKTLKYAKKNNLDENLYSKVAIFGISNKPIDQKKFEKVLEKEVKKHFDVFYLRLCRTGTLNTAQFLGCMKQKQANFVNVKSKGNKIFVGIGTILSLRPMNVVLTGMMNVYVDNNILSYRPLKSRSDLVKYNNSILTSSMKDYVNSVPNVSFKPFH